MKPDLVRLSFKQRHFIQKYIQNSGNSTQAALSVYNVKNTNSAAVIGCRLLRNVKVQGEISRIFESEEPILPRIIQRMNDILNYGSPKEQLKVIRVGLKLYGLL